ncbi:flagellar basal body rod protein FlgB [Thorsellia anophelis]|uniref:Flagellar basal body rod protein FlgB n=1 Tax=Thorsellia anophelis DSM 18579 TaxID=1123402 RepID=A0A1H9ZGE3_9GAMM|nr:flagellar basal body rod protein FlgB [Thorsellia anophelis]SES80388.1 flagellar basal-body rod protein FlgB [Thorsellia anophelis DSM 18579]
MLDKLDASLNIHQQALKVRGLRQEVLASNIANADTPGYQARDIDFSSQLQKAMSGKRIGPTSISLATTSKQHINGKAIIPANGGLDLLYRTPDQPSADGNTVDMDRERINFADNSFRYQASITFLGGRLKSLLSVIQQ